MQDLVQQPQRPVIRVYIGYAHCLERCSVLFVYLSPSQVIEISGGPIEQSPFI